MTSYEYNILKIEIDNLSKQLWCVTKQLTDCCGTPTPAPDCNEVFITVQPQGGTITTGNNLTFSVSVTGDSPITFQWKKNGNIITGATSASYSIVNANSSMSGSYTVTITNPCGVLTSDVASVTVSSAQQTSTVYWGWSDTALTTLQQVTSLQNSGQFATGQNISVSFAANTTPKYLIMAEAVTEPIKTKWYGSDLNNGNIGGSNDLFPAPVIISNLRVYTTAYPTQQTQPLLCSKQAKEWLQR